MERSTENRNVFNSNNENFDCNKMKNLIMDNSEESFSKKFKDWLNIYTRDAREKIWTDIESYRAF